MIQLKRIVTMRPILVIGCVLALLAGRVFAEPAANPLSVKKNTLNAWQLKSSTFDGMVVKMTLGQISDVHTVEVPQQGHFLSLSIDGYVPMGAIGQPALPAYIKIIEIPQGAEPVVNILRNKVEIVDLSVYGDEVPLYPMQAPVGKGVASASGFAYNKQVYTAKGYHAPALVRVEIMGESRGVRLAKLIVSPVEYAPVQNRLRVHTDLEFEIRFEGADYNATQAKKRRYRSHGFRVAEEAGVNAEALRLQTWRAKAGKVEDEQPLRYVVVADPKFRDSLQGFIAWKRQQGYDVVEAYTSDEAVGQTAESIRAYLKGLYDNATEADPAPTYILLVGDTDEIPSFPSRCTKLPVASNHVTDLYFAEYTGDTLPDAYIGRFSASAVEDLMPQIHKTMYMSRIADSAAAFVDTTLLVAGYDENHSLNDAYLNPALRYIQAYAAAESDRVAAIFYPSPKSLFDDEAEDEIIERISSGAGLVFYTGHGLAYEWVTPKISTEVLKKKIFNKDKYPMMVGNCCLSGKFNYITPCFGEQLLRSVDKGAVVYIGATDNTYFDEDFYWIVGVTDIDGKGKDYTYGNTGIGAMDCFYHTHGEPYADWAVTGADIIYRGNMAVAGSGSVLDLYYWEVYELFGDPSYRPYKKKPFPTPIDCAAEAVVGTSSLSVRTAPYAQLSLNDTNGMSVAVVSADAYGFAELPIATLQEGVYRIYGGASGYSDNEKTVKAVKPEGKFVFAESVQLYDGNEAVTNGEYGKRYGVSLKVKNLGAEAINRLSVRLRSDSPYFKAEDDYVYTLSIEPGTQVDLDKSLFFSIATDVPDWHLITYEVELTPDDAEPVVRAFRLMATAPDLQLVGLAFDDATAANPNGVLDPGEKVKVVLSLYNAGGAAARAIQTTFNAEKDYLILPQSPADWGTIAAGDTVTRAFELGAEADKARNDAYSVICKMDADGRVQEVEIASYIEVGVETFETGGFGFAVMGQTASGLNLHFKADKERQGRLYILNALGERAVMLATDLRIAAGENDYTFPVAGLKPGLYVCVFESADGRAAVKFIKR